MTPFLHQVRSTIEKHQMLLAEDRVLVGVSGGADSTALVLSLKQLGYNVAVAHLNHKLRGADSDGDEAFVGRLAAELKVPFFSKGVDVSTLVGNVEANGRAARREFFRELMAEHGFSKIAVAHHREDRVETFLLHLMRGAGSEGLVSMGPMHEQTVRPLLESSRAEIEAYLSSLGRSWRTDQTNSDMSFTRNRMRHEVIPQLASLFNVRLVEGLSRTLNLLQDEDVWMSALAEVWLKEHTMDLGIDAKALRDVPAALARRVIRLGLRRAGSSLTDVTFDHVEAIRGLLEDGKSGKVIPLPGGIVAAREFDRLALLSEAPDVGDFDYELAIPGTVHIPELGRAFRAEVMDHAEQQTKLNSSPARVFVDGSRIGACVNIRNWKPGDYYKPAGWPAGKVKKLFQRARVPRSQRCRWPVFVTETTIVWVASFPVSREFLPGGLSQKIVAFEALED
jgi:tRNA(Ile)-lysidine synthase